MRWQGKERFLKRFPGKTRSGKDRGNGKKTAYLGVLLCFALILSYVESLVPFSFGVPGAKLGLANLAVVLVLYRYGWREAILLNVMRVVLAGFIFGNLFMVMYSLAGAVCSFMAMCAFKKTGKFGMAGVSMAGGIFHNVGQAAVAVFVTETAGVVYYLPALMAAGVATGLVIGIAAREVTVYAKKAFKNGEDG